MKNCDECQQDKPLTDFYRHPTCLDGRTRLCKVCYKKRTKIYKNLNPEKSKNHRKKYDQSVRGKLNRLVRVAKERATKLNKEFDLDFSFIVTLFEQQSGVCSLTGIPFDLSKTKHSRRPFCPSLDRIDSTRGYTKDNVRLVCTAVNLALNEWGIDVFEQVAKGYLRQQT